MIADISALSVALRELIQSQKVIRIQKALKTMSLLVYYSSLGRWLLKEPRYIRSDVGWVMIHKV